MSNSNNCVAVILYRKLETLPPVMTLLTVLKKLGRPVHYIGLASDAAEKFLVANDIPHTLLDYPAYPTKLNRLLSFFPRRRAVLAKLAELRAQYGDVTLWFQEFLSAAWVGDAARAYKSRIITMFEFGCLYGSRWLRFNARKALDESVIVECEPNRAYFEQYLQKLKTRPLVIVNKPLLDPKAIPPLNDEAKAVFEKIGNRPVFLYQGYISKERGDVPLILETIAKNRPDYCVLSLPGSPELNAQLAPYPNAFTLNRITAPGHLAVTARATVGIAVYRGTGSGTWGLNALYCAPNKTYEYAAFGIPTLGNKIPGLEYSIGMAKSGICCEMTPDAILEAADDLIDNIEVYRENAKRFYRDADVQEQIRIVLSRSEDSRQ